MSTNKVTPLLGVLLATAVIFGVSHHVHVLGQGHPPQDPTAAGDIPGMKMPGMDISKPSAGPAAAAAPPTGYAEVHVGQEAQQRIGVMVGKVEQSPLTMTIRAVGIVRPDETRVAHVHIKTEGWVEKLYVSFTGEKVSVGEPLLSIYSPTFFAAQREFLSALRAAKVGLDSAGDQQTVVETARRRLELWDIPKDEIDKLEKTGEPGKSLILRSPISGTVLEKQAFAGQYVMMQSDLFVVADLSRVWMQAKVFQYELPHVAIGMPATVTFASLPLRKLTGKVVFIDPVVDEMSRSVQVRIELPNADGTLRPGMFGNVVITHAMGTGLTIPSAAVIRTGERDIVYRVVSADRFMPVPVKISPTRFADRFEVLEGLKAGDEVVTSGNFLIDSESRLEAGGGGMAGMPGMDDAATPDAAKVGPKK